MELKTTRRKVLPQPERTAALTAISTAQRRHKYVGLRPKKQRRAGPKSTGILLPEGSNPGTGLNQALRMASGAWPDSDCWELFGSNEFADFPESSEESGDGYFGDPRVYGEFETVDEPGWMGGYPA